MAENRRWIIIAALILGVVGVGAGYLIWRSGDGAAEPARAVYEGPGFVVFLPGTPTEEVTTEQGPTGPMETHHLVLEPEGQEISYRLDYRDYPPGLLAGFAALGGAQNPDWVHASVGSLASQLAGTVASEVPLSLAGHPGNEVTIDGPEGRTTIARIYLVERRDYQHRLYRLIVTTPSEQASRREIREFLDSFELVEPSSSEDDPDL